MMKVPFVDLRAQYDSIKQEMDDAIGAVVRAGAFIGGPHLKGFEAAFADYCGATFALGVSNGTDALRLALLGCGVGPGDEVITVPNTFIATAEAISMVGATVRWVDVTPDTFTMDPQGLERAITTRTRAVVPVHLYGHPAEMDRILPIARQHGLRVVADAAQAHGAIYGGERTAALGDVACFSFYPGKNLGAYGDAGAVVTDDREVARVVRLLRDHGRTEKYIHEREGFNCRMDALQAAILSVKLRHLESWTKRRREHAMRYGELLDGCPGVRQPVELAQARGVYHLYAIQVEGRDTVRARLEREGIATGVHYPVPLHLQPAYRHLNLQKGSFPVAEAQAERTLSLPMFPELTDEQIEFVATTLRRAVTV